MGTQVIFLKPLPQLEDSISLMTDSRIHSKSYIVNDKDITLLENSQGYIAKVPEKSNLRKMDGLINKFKKNFVLTDEYEYNPKDEPTQKKYYIDKSGKEFAVKNETEDGLRYDLRLDLAMQMINAGYNLVQCNQKSCVWFKPQTIKIDFNKKMI